MAFTIVDWATHAAPVATTYERIILMILADRVSLDGTGAYRSKRTLAEAALCNEKTVQNYLRSMRKRGLIAYGDQALVSKLPKGQQPYVYDVLMPYSQYPPWALEKANAERAEKGLDPLTPQNRPDIAPPAADVTRKTRSDKGAARPERHKRSGESSDDDEGGMTVPPVDNSTRGEYESPPGGNDSPPRGEYESPPGGNDSPPNLSGGNLPEEPVLRTRVSHGEAPPPPSGGDAREVDGETEHEVGTSQPAGDSNAGKGEIPNEDPDDELARKRAKDRVGTFLADTVMPKVPRELRESLTAEEKGRIWELATDAHLLRIPNATVLEQLSNVAGTRYLGKAWEQKLTALVNQARAETAQQAERKRSRPACTRCGAREGSGLHERTVLTDPYDPHAADQPCPNCHSNATGTSQAS